MLTEGMRNRSEKEVKKNGQDYKIYMFDNDDKKAEITTWDEVHLFTRNN